jgi:hypothetical protein
MTAPFTGQVNTSGADAALALVSGSSDGVTEALGASDTLTLALSLSDDELTLDGLTLGEALGVWLGVTLWLSSGSCVVPTAVTVSLWTAPVMERSRK